MRIGERVRLYHPDPRRNGMIRGTIVGGGFIGEQGPVYLVELDKQYQGYVSSPEIGEYDHFVSTVIVDITGVMGA